MPNASLVPSSSTPAARRSRWIAGLAAFLLAGCIGPGPAGQDTIASVSPTVRSMSQATLSVVLVEPGEVAAACIARDDPAEVHLVEGSANPEVELGFAGLLPATDYDCSVGTTSVEGPPVLVGFRTDDPPPDISIASADAIFDPVATMTGAYTVMNVKPECRVDNDRNYIAVLDPEGNNRWRYELPVGMNIGIEVAPDGPNRFLWGGGKHSAGAPEVVDVLDGTQWKLSFPGSEYANFHHDVRRIADGQVLSVEQHDDPGWLATQLRLSNEAGETTWLWDMQRAVEDGWLPAGGSTNYDPHHVNWADVVDSGDGPIAYLSLCFSHLIMAVDVASGDVLWRFGAGADFTLVDASGAPLGDDEFPQCQHGLQIDGTRMLVYDNGLKRGYTRSVEYEIDVETMVATKTWEWRDDPEFWELYHGGMDWLTPDHDRVLVAQGNNGCDEDGRRSQIVEVDRGQGDLVVHRLILRDVSDWIYRAHRVDGCELFANTRYCPALAARFEALRPTLGL